jgi:hypothetical protein
MVLAIDVVDSETPDHEHLPMGKIQDVHDAEDQRDPERDQRIGCRQNDGVEENLSHGTLASRPPRAAIRNGETANGFWLFDAADE